jgi:hypothetical protein
VDAERFVRQAMVAEIGEAGQRSIAASAAPVLGATLAHQVARTYAERAGFEALAPGPAELDPGAPPEWVADPSARSVLAGARAAVRCILDAVPGARAGGPR